MSDEPPTVTPVPTLRPSEIRPEPHSFNDDLLLPHFKGGETEDNNSRTVDFAKHFPDLAFAFDFKPLRVWFANVDAKANQLKKESRSAGWLAVRFAGAGLYLAALAMLFTSHEGLAHIAHVVLSVTGMMLGILGVVYGLFSIVRSGAKMKWLIERVRTERCRQFHFQNALMRLDDLIAAAIDAGKRDAYRQQTAALFEDFILIRADKADAEFEFINAHDQDNEPDWLIKRRDPAPADVNDAMLQTFYKAYELLRFEHQKSYTRNNLKPTSEIRRQERTLSRLAVACIVIIAALHFIGVLVLATPIDGVFIDVLVIIAALTALLGKAIEEGLQPQREVERYADYLSNIEVAHERFQKAASSGEKFAAMLDFERVSYEEMKHFLRTHQRARFIP